MNQNAQNANSSQGDSSYRDIVFKKTHQRNKEFSTPADLDNIFTLQSLFSTSSLKYLDQPVSSDGMILRTSFKVRFEVSKTRIFQSKSKTNNMSEKIIQKQQSMNEKKAKKILKRKVDRMNSDKPFVEFPIQLIYEDKPGNSFVLPLDRQDNDGESQQGLTRKLSIDPR